MCVCVISVYVHKLYQLPKPLSTINSILRIKRITASDSVDFCLQNKTVCIDMYVVHESIQNLLNMGNSETLLFYFIMRYYIIYSYFIIKLNSTEVHIVCTFSKYIEK